MRQSQRQGSAQATNYRPYFEGDGVDSPGEQFWNSLTAGDEDQELFRQLKRFLAVALTVGPSEFLSAASASACQAHPPSELVIVDDKGNGHEAVLLDTLFATRCSLA